MKNKSPEIGQATQNVIEEEFYNLSILLERKRQERQLGASKRGNDFVLSTIASKETDVISGNEKLCQLSGLLILNAFCA